MSNEALVLFIHGLGGDPVDTWGKFPHLVREDAELGNTFDTASFQYPTKLLRAPLSKRAPRIQTLSGGLRTAMRTRYEKYSSIALICHSLGGLIARRYLVEELTAQRPSAVDRALLFATPNNGSDLTAVGQLLSAKHDQLRQLCEDSDFLLDLNTAWADLKVEEHVKVRYVMGSQDAVVSEQSARGYWGTGHCDVVLDKDHRSIVKPAAADDIAFALTRQFLTSDRVAQAKNDEAIKVDLVNIRPTPYDATAEVLLHLNAGQPFNGTTFKLDVTTLMVWDFPTGMVATTGIPVPLPPPPRLLVETKTNAQASTYMVALADGDCGVLRFHLHTEHTITADTPWHVVASTVFLLQVTLSSPEFEDWSGQILVRMYGQLTSGVSRGEPGIAKLEHQNMSAKQILAAADGGSHINYSLRKQIESLAT